MPRTCANPDCGAEIPPQRGRARPRKYCETCRPSRGTPNPRVVKLTRNVSVSEQGDDPASGAETGLVTAYGRQLAAADRLETPEGAHVMHLARLFAAGNHTASGAASLSRELRAALAEALKGAPAAADKLDELAARRQAKAEGA